MKKPRGGGGRGASPTSSCCIGLFICGIVAALTLLCLSLLYWSIPGSRPISHHFSKVSAERFSSGLELQEADPVAGQGISETHSHVLFTWQSPMCAEAVAGSRDQDPAIARFHVQFWTDMGWRDFLRTSFTTIRLADTQDVTDATTGSSSMLPGNIYSDDCFVVLENALTAQQISFRVRSRVDHAIFQLFKPQWSVWSDVVVLPPATKELTLCDPHGVPYEGTLWCVMLVCVVVAIYTRCCAPGRDSMHGAKRKIKALQEEVANLKQELADAESENKHLMRLKGYGLENLSWKELHELERELHMGLEAIECLKEEMHPSLSDDELHQAMMSRDSTSSTASSHLPDDDHDLDHLLAN
ncbi:Aste57867_24381 [Aphanomyces stellatus]|uniref:Aste57867_24381 protein n=1 Tax=Aphanomyces stellatus TaxID=120398 RepID=A0A485LUM4_9STRA|nr:hypothetical protein As57867_024305 [Aphanomyces stellatus]VFU01021.1 Aste57867_24381 [Aphanomyces stellatus]